MNSPHVATPLGLGVVEAVTAQVYFVRTESGERYWLPAAVCEQVASPAGYEPPSLRNLPGALA